MVRDVDEIIVKLLKKGFLVGPDNLKNLNNMVFNELDEFINLKNKPLVINEDIQNLILENKLNLSINWKDLEKARVNFEKKKDKNIYFSLLSMLKGGKNKSSFKKILEDIKKPVKPVITIEKNPNPNPIVLRNYRDKEKKITVQTFVDYYKIRYNKLRKILQFRQELSDTVSLDRIRNRRKGDKISLIGMIYSKEYTKNKHLIFEIEDVTGKTKCLVMNNKEELFEKAKDIVCDEVLGIKGSLGDGLIFVDNIYFPDMPKDEILKKGQKEEYLAFISDLQIGSKKFLRKSFLKFIDWINGEYGTNEQRNNALKVKYLFVVGDVVDGVGIYPGQEEDLEIKDIKEQYSECARLFSKIRKDVKIIFSPGNHDAVRLAEPQPFFDRTLSEDLWNMENSVMVTNPSLINVGATQFFEGLNILMYHGYSFDYYVDYLDNIRNNGGYDNVCELMKLLLLKRHLAPTHTSNLTVVDSDEDYMVIDEIPDIFVTGHVHKAKISQQGKTTLIASSCWQSKTAYEEKMGHDPEPGKVALVNLKTRETKFMKFLIEDE